MTVIEDEGICTRSAVFFIKGCVVIGVEMSKGMNRLIEDVFT